MGGRATSSRLSWRIETHAMGPNANPNELDDSYAGLRRQQFGERGYTERMSVLIVRNRCCNAGHHRSKKPMIPTIKGKNKSVTRN